MQNVGKNNIGNTMIDDEIKTAAFLTVFFIIGCIGIYAFSMILYALIIEYLLLTILIVLGISTIFSLFYAKIKSER